MPAHHRSTEGMKKWIRMETRFREAQLSSSLEGICHCLALRSRLHLNRTLNIRNQKGSTRARDTLDRNDRKLDGFKQKYRAAWKALGCIGWAALRQYRELKDEDIRSLVDMDMQALRNRRKILGATKRREDDDVPAVVPGEAKKVNSWIWKDFDIDSEGEEMKEICRVEWTKAWARQRRWDEELALVEEEMRRTLVTLRHDAEEWRKRAEKRTVSKHEREVLCREGRRAYALRQAAIREGLASKFHALWLLPDPKPKVKRKAKVVMEEAGAYDPEEESDGGSSDGED
ncbi:hypothetical protein VNI00_019008 [Paramarasmius palmivorus]|uniref:Uncharacterized protein n=1 Tax=Paramarasmius palmivorus TaxID=297713 RepID=A0AAW0AS80_9AGAR